MFKVHKYIPLILMGWCGTLAHAQFYSNNHPGRTTPNTHPHQNLVWVFPATVPMQPFVATSWPSSGRLYSPNSFTIPYPNTLSRYEHWQRINSTWFITQFQVVTHTGQALAEMFNVTKDRLNPSRTRQGTEWRFGVHWNNIPVRITNSAGQIRDIGAYPIKFYLRHVNAHSNNWFVHHTNITAASSPGPYPGRTTGMSHPFNFNALNPVSNTSSSPLLVSAGVNGMLNGTEINLGSTNITIMPTHSITLTSSIPTRFVGSPESFPIINYAVNNLYPQGAFQVLLIKPDGVRVELINSSVYGSEWNMTPLSYNSSLDIRPHLTTSGSYRLEFWLYTPVDEGVPPPGITTTPSFAGGWTRVDVPGLTEFDVQLEIRVSGMLISG